jgi:chromosome segregation ATPase
MQQSHIDEILESIETFDIKAIQNLPNEITRLKESEDSLQKKINDYKKLYDAFETKIERSYKEFQKITEWMHDTTMKKVLSVNKELTKSIDETNQILTSEVNRIRSEIAKTKEDSNIYVSSIASILKDQIQEESSWLSKKLDLTTVHYNSLVTEKYDQLDKEMIKRDTIIIESIASKVERAIQVTEKKIWDLEERIYTIEHALKEYEELYNKNYETIKKLTIGIGLISLVALILSVSL